MTQVDSTKFNQEKWDQIAKDSDKWFKAVTTEEIAAAKSGDWKIRLTAQKNIPQEWLLPLTGKQVLCLAGGGGRQAPILAAAGAKVTVFDISSEQLKRDQEIADREELSIRTIAGDMTNMKELSDDTFDLIVNPCSLCYVSKLEPVWAECCRVLKMGGVLVSGMINPVNYLFDEAKKENGELVVRHQIPYSDLDLPEEERLALHGDNRPIDFGHSLESQLGGLLNSGFLIDRFFEDSWGANDQLSKHISTFFAVRAIKADKN